MNYTIERIVRVAGDLFAPEKKVSFDKFYWPTLDEVACVTKAEFDNYCSSFEVSIFVENDCLTISGKRGRSYIRGIPYQEHIDATETISADHSIVRVVPDAHGGLTYLFITDAILFALETDTE
ncbi:MAG: hypothetical protein HY225_03550 [Candidatus Vogelbacteria bacterium]|nr:hypothetical protein [Candidatus Vogelbacteria bacterium]